MTSSSKNAALATKLVDNGPELQCSECFINTRDAIVKRIWKDWEEKWRVTLRKHFDDVTCILAQNFDEVSQELTDSSKRMGVLAVKVALLGMEQSYKDYCPGKIISIPIDLDGEDMFSHLRRMDNKLDNIITATNRAVTNTTAKTATTEMCGSCGISMNPPFVTSCTQCAKKHFPLVGEVDSVDRMLESLLLSQTDGDGDNKKVDVEFRGVKRIRHQEQQPPEDAGKPEKNVENRLSIKKKKHL